MNIGFIGLGTMGRPMAAHLAKHGHAVSTVRRSRPLPDDLAAVVAVHETAAEVAHNSDITILMLPDTPDVEQVLFDKDGVVDGLSAGKIVVDMSSIDPIATRRFAERIAETGAQYADAPVSGGEIAAVNASLTIMVGADADTFERVRPVLELMGSSVNHIGDVGAGQTTKVANQIVVGVTISAVCEALELAERAGVDPARVRDALLGGFASSRILDVHGKRMIDEAFAPGFRIRLQRKDLGLALKAASALDIELPQAETSARLFQTAIDEGDGDLDHSALLRTYRRQAARTPR